MFGGSWLGLGRSRVGTRCYFVYFRGLWVCYVESWEGFGVLCILLRALGCLEYVLGCSGSVLEWGLDGPRQYLKAL